MNDVIRWFVFVESKSFCVNVVKLCRIVDEAENNTNTHDKNELFRSK